MNNHQPFLELLRNNPIIKYPVNKLIFSVCISLRLVLLIYTWNNVIGDRKNNIFLPIQLSDITFLITSFFIFIFIIIQFSKFYEEIYSQFSNNRVLPLSINIDNILKNKSYNPKKDDQCSICLCVYLENKKMKWIQLDCKHSFHIDCIQKWFQNDILCTCPLCRVENV
jgi:hypothetical protein